MSTAPALLEVTNDNPSASVRVGTASPGVVAPGATVDVVFTLPDGNLWAIVVNRQTLIIPQDIEGRSGQLPITIQIDAAGNSGWTAPDDWFGP